MVCCGWGLGCEEGESEGSEFFLLRTGFGETPWPATCEHTPRFQNISKMTGLMGQPHRLYRLPEFGLAGPGIITPDCHQIRCSEIKNNL